MPSRFVPAGSPEAKLARSAKHGSIKKVRRMLDAGIGPDGKDESGWTPLMWAAAEGTPKS